MFHKYNPFTNTLSQSDQISAYVPQSFGSKEATNNFYVAPQPKGRQPGGSGPHGAGSVAGRQMSIFRLLTNRSNSSTPTLASTAQNVAAVASQGVASAAQTAASTIQAATSAATSAATNAAANVASNIQAATSAAHGAVSGSHGTSNAAHGHGHGHGSHAAPWEGVNLWRTPYKGNTDTITQVKRNKGTLDQYVENRTRHIQQLQLHALRTKAKPTWIMLPRDKALYAIEGLIVAYVLYQVTSTVYNHLKSKDRLKLLKLLYKDNVD